MIQTIGYFVCFALVLASSAFAADDNPPARSAPAATQPAAPVAPVAPLAPDSVSVPAPPPLSVRDPTEAQAALRQAIENMHGPGSVRPRAAGLPQVIRRGLVMVSGKPPEALIEVMGAGIFFVHEGSSISAGPNDGTIRMRITRITADEIEINVESQRQTVIIR